MSPPKADRQRGPAGWHMQPAGRHLEVCLDIRIARDSIAGSGAMGSIDGSDRTSNTAEARPCRVDFRFAST